MGSKSQYWSQKGRVLIGSSTGEFTHARRSGGGEGWGNSGQAVRRAEIGQHSKDCPAGYHWNSYRRRCTRIGNTSGLKRMNHNLPAPRMGRTKQDCRPGYRWNSYRQRCDRSFYGGNAGQPLYPRDMVGEHSSECPPGYYWNQYRRRCVTARG